METKLALVAIPMFLAAAIFIGYILRSYTPLSFFIAGSSCGLMLASLFKLKKLT
ncbi:hypothetical protein [Pseudoalteromonas neustonica]|uniref:hypothetical protein n=1 Tax=Pseudoalteromonas neustonica TaxID=1840331 RepID=UPI0012FD51EC|nr:hypothetical protein [Pseudoalteromonas neustonica]